MEKSRNKSWIAIVILSVLLCATVGFIIYDQVFSANNDNQEEESPSSVSVVDVVDIKSKQYLTYICDNINRLANIRIPMITSNKTGAITLNEKMGNESLDRVFEYIEAISPDDPENEWASFTLDYKSMKKNDIIAIYVTGDVDDYAQIGSSVPFPIQYNYFYDIKNDREIPIEEAIPLLGYSFEKYGVSSYEELYEKFEYPKVYIEIDDSGNGTLQVINQMG